MAHSLESTLSAPYAASEKAKSTDLPVSFEFARSTLLTHCTAVDSELIPLQEAFGRIVSKKIFATANIPPFARSSYDGYALKACDSIKASLTSPITLRVIDCIGAGQKCTLPVTTGTAVRIMTGAPLPYGADAVIMDENTAFSHDKVRIHSTILPQTGFCKIGSEITLGQNMADCGKVLTPALMGALAAQNIQYVTVFKKPTVGIIVTGNELVTEQNEPLLGGIIGSSNRHMLEAACMQLGAQPLYLGWAQDKASEIAALIEEGLNKCDMIIISGGVSGGDYDFTPMAMEQVNATILLRRIRIKPGGACAYGMKNKCLIFGLTGRPIAALINFYSFIHPCLRKMSGHKTFLSAPVQAVLADDFKKESLYTRIICGRLELCDSAITMRPVPIYRNTALHEITECNALSIIPAGSPPLPAGTKLETYLLESG